MVTEHNVHLAYYKWCYLCCVDTLSAPRAWLYMPLLIVMGIWDSLCTLQQKQLVTAVGCDILSLEIQAVALASTNDYFCACVLGICIVFFQSQAFKYSASLLVQSHRSREDLNAKMPQFLSLNLFVYVFKITMLFFFSVFMWTIVKLVFSITFKVWYLTFWFFCCLFVCFFLLGNLMGKNLGF